MDDPLVHLEETQADLQNLTNSNNIVGLIENFTPAEANIELICLLTY